MERRFNATGERRKEMVKVISGVCPQGTDKGAASVFEGV